DVAIRSHLDQHHNLPSIAACDRRQWLVVVALALLEPLHPAASKITPAALLLFSAPFQSLPPSVGHALVKGWPILPTFVLLFVPLPLAIGPFGGVLGVDTDAFDDAVADAGGAGFVAGGDTEV